MSAAASDYISKYDFVAMCAGFCLVAGLLAPATPAAAQETMGHPAPRMDRMDRGGGSSAVGIGVGIGIGIIGGALQEGETQPNKGAASSEQSRTRGKRAKASDDGRTKKSHGSTKKVARQSGDPPKRKGGKKDDKTVKKDDDGKKDKKTVKKDDDRKKDTTGRNENDEIVEVDCVLIVQYKNDNEIFKESQAHNEDLENSGSAGVPEGGTILKTSGDLPGAIGPFTKGKKKCCKSFSIVSHGLPNGSIMLPYAIEGSDTPIELGGPSSDAKTGKAANQEHFGKFVKALKGALCKTGKPTVTFNTCYGGVDGGIAEQVAAQGLAAKGWDGYCEMGPVVDEKTQKKTWSAPRPDPTGNHTPANLQSFTPKEAEKKK